MTEWKRNRILKGEKIAAIKAMKKKNSTSYIGNILKKIQDKIVRIIKNFWNNL